jgi:hypothetical protein
MKLEKILDHLNSFEKNSFLKIIDGIISGKPKNANAIDKILSEKSRDLKSVDNINIANVFNLVATEFATFISKEFVDVNSQLDIVIDIISRDGKCIMKQDWFGKLYEKEIHRINQEIKSLSDKLENSNGDMDEQRRRDYLIYKNCLRTAYLNDLEENLDPKITPNELSILLILSKQLEISQEEIKLINYMIIPAKKIDTDDVINNLRSIGVLLHSRKNNTVYIADEIVSILRKVRGNEVADKYFRRVLRLLKEPQINLVCKKHNIDRKLSIDQKIQDILAKGVPFTNFLKNDIFRDGTLLSEKKKFLNDLCDTGLMISPSLRGATIEEKIVNLIKYFDELESDEKVSISIDGYEKLLLELGATLPNLNAQLKETWELQEENVLISAYLLDYNIKPRDVLELISEPDLETFCKLKGVKLRGDLYLNILEFYKDAENLFLENYENIARRDLNKLKENGILIKESELGSKFEELTKTIFTKLNFNVDEKLRQLLSTNKDRSDIVINLGNNEIILVECKTSKESGYNKFSSVSRQLKAYCSVAKLNNYKIIKSLLVSPEFTDDFVKDCGLDYELNLSLMTASSLLKILDGFKNSKHKQLPYNLLMRDVLIQEERILKAIEK